jgi:fatty acid desaturase
MCSRNAVASRAGGLRREEEDDSPLRSYPYEEVWWTGLWIIWVMLGFLLGWRWVASRAARPGRSGKPLFPFSFYFLISVLLFYFNFLFWFRFEFFYILQVFDNLNFILTK